MSDLPPVGHRSAERRAELVVAASFGLTMVSGVGLLVLYIIGGQTQLEGLLLTACLGGLGVGLVVWSHRLMPVADIVEHRQPLGSARADRVAAAEALAEGGLTRRRLLVRLLLGAVAGLGAALAMPVLSLGPAPGRSLFETSWRAGSRVVGVDGEPIAATDLPLGSITTVFPGNAPRAPDSQAVLIHVDPARLELAGDAAGWAPDGFVAYSKICTHAGCPVGLFRAETAELICPCHQSTFDVLRGAVPTYGPAARPLPQLPIRMEPDGTFVALADFPEPVGPGFWDIGQ
jgi:ubiquinol-cytochrome c reductase iron-sulfur subunit